MHFMMSFLELAKRRRTTYEFSPKAVPPSLLSKLLEAARWAPSPLNSQPYSFIVVKSKAAIKGIVDAAYYGNFHTYPSAIIVIALLPEKASEKSHRGMVGGKLGAAESSMSISMPALMMELEAADIGLGACILSLDEKKLPKIGLKKGERALLAVGIGYSRPGTSTTGMHHRRKPLSELVRKGL
ncbi:malonic semialdehyde reductase RutE [uncultured archaeon]|nr:malonic semialdehyde reductase RutE [uncultured archaeon]